MANHPNRNLYWIDNDVAVDPRTKRDHGDNGESADVCVTLYSAIVRRGPANGKRAFYLGANGDPCMVCEGNQTECALDLGWTVDALRAECGEWLEWVNAPAEDEQRETCAELARGDADEERAYLEILGL